MTRRIWALALAAATLISGQALAEDGFVSLFDGKTLSGWEMKARPANRETSKWEVKDGVIVGSGQVIESGTIIVRGGKIASVTAGAAPTQGLRVIDGRGMSAMPVCVAVKPSISSMNTGSRKLVLIAMYCECTLPVMPGWL